MVGIFDCGGVLGKYEIRLKERKVVNMEALNTYKTEKTLAEQMNERLAEMKMTKAEAALKMNYSRAALSQYLNGKYASDPTELEKKVREFLAATGGVAEGQEPENSVPTGAGTLKKKVEFFESRDFVQTIGVCQACQEYMGLGIIVGKSGQGKTHALKKYAELPRVAYIECDDTMACRDLVEAIENGIGLPKGYGGTIWSRVNRIREFFNTNEGFLLIIDEADKLINKYTQKKMEILRGIFDQSNVGIVIAGEPRLETELKGNLARFANRMDFYYKLKGLSKNEVVGHFVGCIQGIISALTPLTNALSSLVSFVTNVVNMIVSLFKGDFSGALDFASAAVGDLKDFFFNCFDAILSFLGGFASGFLDVVGGALSAIGIDATETITKMKDTIKNGLEAVKGFFGNILGAASDTVKEKLGNMKAAYEEHGGGIKGVAAAAVEGVKQDNNHKRDIHIREMGQRRRHHHPSD